MPVQTCSFLFRREIWARCPYPSEYRVVGDHVWFRRQMKLGLNLDSVRKPIGLFTWHQDEIATRLGPHQENALVDVSRKSLRMRLAKIRFRIRHLLEGGLYRPAQLAYALWATPSCVENRAHPRPLIG
jgi:hypothetical protein